MDNMNFETQQSINHYEDTKNILLESINNNINTIILVGRGNNGKTTLIKELLDTLTSNNYSIMFESFLHLQTENRFANLLNMPEKKILEMPIDPFYKFNMNIPSNTVLIDMNHIIF